MEKAAVIHALIAKRMKEEILTGLEENQLEDWLNASPENRVLYESFIDPSLFHEKLKEYSAIISYTSPTSPIESTVTESNPVVSLPVIKRKRIWLAAASLLLLISVSGVLYFSNQPRKQNAPAITVTQADGLEAPGSNKALLILADGSRIVLDNAQNGTIAEQHGTSIRKQEDGQLMYVAPDGSNTTAASDVLNTVSTPRGGQYEIRLPDGSKAWLNAATSLSFPVAFGKERLVTVSGEVYFEVAKDAQKPFIVSIAGAQGKDASIKVLGTHFNVSAYPDENNIVTTLLEGSVQVKTGSNASLLKPGQAANIDQHGALAINKQANTEQAIAWKNGSFVFANQDIGTIMRQIGRWYNLDVVIKGTSGDKYYGEISKFKQLGEVLHLLEQYGIVFELDKAARTIVVKP